ncbi:MAG: tRNA (adenosine(37)-N6)-dimethylallyltransferase MiaA [Lachnospiraceae bacterium]|nr:tRNA (adenosine(37)-N6)-dimethylallyltransferase MiaA [Lachnospiraceae bacterium]
MNDKKMIIITGPTAVGKSDISIKLAKRINGEIISADSIQVYRGLDIGSAKISESEREGVKHYLIDCLDPDEYFDVTGFVKLAEDASEKIYAKGKLPIMVGGTAFYIQAFLKGVDFDEENHDMTYRESLAELDEDELYDTLKSVDPDYAATVHKNNKKRVIRALEYNHFTGKMFSGYNSEQSEKPGLYDDHYFVLTDKRELLYDRIDKRVDKMMNGLVEEVKGLMDSGYGPELKSMQSIGYREICEYLNGTCTLQEAADNIKTSTRHYAKRQLTWFKREKNAVFINRSDFDGDNDKIVDHIVSQIGLC